MVRAAAAAAAVLVTVALTAMPTPASAARLGSTGNPRSKVVLDEAGSTLLYPYLQVLAPRLHRAYGHITLDPGPGGSGKGISDAIAGLTPLGGSDAYLSPALFRANPGLLNIPIAISAQAVDYNVPGVGTHLRLSGNVLARIYQGQITRWNDAAIARLNRGAHLPAMRIVPVRRVDSSGDTFIFTSWLAATDRAWARRVSYGTTVSWPPVGDELSASGNPGMIQVCHNTPGCIAYIGVSVETTALRQGLKEALLQSRGGAFVLPTHATIEAAVAAGARATPKDLAQSLIDEPGAGAYPIVNFEYLVMRSHQPSARVALAIRTFLTWAISPTGGATTRNLAVVGFAALPTVVLAKVRRAIDRIAG
ncbi:MAG TPA: phosphate ABC transporter substrate-binding protein PstS [Candidatus Micrarchaeia archaeon]|nr:phosphate ABC transporter substrate-binding protein PstS [Candidatus Micrarchaeia archaeon]